jgi:hypothetical protein
MRHERGQKHDNYFRCHSYMFSSRHEISNRLFEGRTTQVRDICKFFNDSDSVHQQ